MPAPCRAISAIISGSVTGSPSRRLNCAIRRRLSIRTWPESAAARTWLARLPLSTATAANTTSATRSSPLPMVKRWIGGRKK